MYARPVVKRVICTRFSLYKSYKNDAGWPGGEEIIMSEVRWNKKVGDSNMARAEDM